MRRITVGLYSLHYHDAGGKDIKVGDTVSYYREKLYKVVESDDKEYLGIVKNPDGTVSGFTEEAMQHFRKVILTNEEAARWKALNFAPLKREELAV